MVANRSTLQTKLGKLRRQRDEAVAALAALLAVLDGDVEYRHREADVAARLLVERYRRQSSQETVDPVSGSATHGRI